MRLRTWLPPGAARGLGRRLLLVVALAPPIAWLAQAVLPGTAGYGTALTRSQSQTDLRARAASYGMPAAAVDGMDAVAVHQAASALAGLVREGGGPAFLALNTYRFRAHSMFDPELYRSRQEVQDWITRCPIARLRDRLQSLDLLDAAGFTALESAADDEVADAVTFAEAGTWEPVSDLARDLVAAEPAP